VGTTVLRDRHHLSQDGFFIVMLALDVHSGEIVFGPEIITRGFVYSEAASDILEGAKEEIVKAVKHGIVGTALTVKLKEVLSQYLYKQTHRRPMVIPMVTEV
jgi:ribonuclease J